MPSYWSYSQPRFRACVKLFSSILSRECGTLKVLKRSWDQSIPSEKKLGFELVQLKLNADRRKQLDTKIEENKSFKTHAELATPISTEALAQGQVLLEIDSFALTANVISYAMAGEAIGYYEFFPVQDMNNQQDWGRVPTWGTCTVVASKCSFVPKGQRVYGLIPLSRYLVASPKQQGLNTASWVDSAPHRQKRDIVYNTYWILDKDPMYPGPAYEDAMILVRPLFLTSWLLREALSGISNMETLVITSASSKTGASLAALMKQRRYDSNTGPSKNKLEIIGMTSPSNVSYCKSLNYFDEIVTYSTSISNKKNVVIVDMAGNLDVLRDLQRTLKSSLLKIISVGMTHVEGADMAATLSGDGFDPNYVKPEFFFAPKYAAAVAKKNPLALTVDVAKDWKEFIVGYPLDIKRCETVQEVNQVLQDFVHGRIPGNVSWIGCLKSDGDRSSL